MIMFVNKFIMCITCVLVYILVNQKKRSKQEQLQHSVVAVYTGEIPVFLACPDVTQCTPQKLDIVCAVST